MTNDQPLPSTLPVAHARYLVKDNQIEVVWQNADAPGIEAHGRSCYRMRELPRALKPLFQRCLRAERRCYGDHQVTDWIELTDGEMILLGLKRL